MTASEINMTHSTDAHWENLVQTVNDLQNRVSLKQIDTVSALFQSLVEQQRLPCVTPQELSVVYRDYGQSQCTWVVHEGRVVTDANAVGLAADNPLILEVLDNNALVHYPTLNGIEACHQAGFAGYQSVVIVPMKLDDYRRLGAFVILNKTQPSAYSPEASRILDVLSDRVALLLKTVQRQMHEEESSHLEASLMHGAWQITRECQILEQTYHSLRQRYPSSNVYCLVKNQLDTDNYYLASNAGQDALIQDFRLMDTLAKEELYNIVGGEENLQTMAATNFRYERAFAALPLPAFSHIDSDVMSWLGATIYHAEGTVLGHFILHNKMARYAYDQVDQHLLNDACKTTGASLSFFSRRQKEKVIVKLSDIKDENALYTEAFDYLQTAYGVKSLLIYAVNTATQDWGVKFQNGIFIKPDTVFRNLVIKVAQEYRISPKDDERKKQYVEYPENSNDKYVVVPMRTKDENGDFRVVGCFVIPAQDQSIIATRIMDEVSDALAKRKKELDDDARQKKLNEYVKKVSKLWPNDLIIEKSLELAKEAIAEIMFSANLYFALYDQEKNEISFPVIYKDGMPWEGIQNRPINPEKQGRTEAIILTGEPILIKTLVDSKAWYDPKLNRQEFAGNPLASWVGVPIFNDKGVRGVIAVYHPDLEYVYSSKDLGFLEIVAGAISTLFRMVEVNGLYQENKKKNIELISLNRSLKNSNKKIIELENANTMAFLSLDLTHRLVNSISILKINAEQTIDDISVTQKTGNIQLLTYTIDGLKDSISVVNDLYSEIREMVSADDKDIDVAELIKHIAAQIKIVYKLNHQVKIEINKNTPNILRGKYRLIFNAIYSLADNAAKSLLSVKERENLFIRINAYRSDNFIVIEVVDNGCSVPENALSDINEPSLNKGHYGLWRTKHILESMGGSYNPEIDTISNIKKIGLYFPIKCEEPDSGKGVVLVLDDENSWTNILRRWLVEYGFEVKLASSIDEMNILISENKNIGAVFLDVSLNKVVGSDTSGLSVIDKVRNKCSHAKVFIVTGYEHFLQNTTHDIDHVFKKIEDNGDALNKGHLYKVLDGFFVK
ncbi:sensor histidine kinase [Candidatus Thiothrix anitrata]|uniref:GAF domain-containing protein n=1 Tax=Candidatus Thiothrix anitrata TaxID=2823902 RepID=A0ABX7X6R2_9GAMM|nr:GAF domain-containing protein [Candidatus Thiothrix anitrata]QTR51017.1 GAF domain-containing protein [Candidatus Thiothrix anitrata]